MKLRPPQVEFVDKSLEALASHRRVMSVMATGGGKTIVASEIMTREIGNCLMLVDAEELIKQASDKYFQHTGELAGVEWRNQTARLGEDRVIIATTQTLHRRLDKYPDDYFNLIIIDEAHRNTLGAMAEKVLNHFGEYAKILGVTATPWRSDNKKLGDFYEVIAVDIGLDRLIKEGWLSRITIKGVPLNIDLSKVRSKGKDFNATDLDEVIDKHLVKAAVLLRDTIAEHKRKAVVVFLPLVKTSQRFADILLEMGVKAVHADGNDREAVALFAEEKATVICNAALLTTGWDCPQVDCVYILRPTKSLTLFSQMVGRGTRIHKGKDHLLLLDPLYLHEDHRLINAAHLVASDPAEVEEIMKKVREGGVPDLILAERDAEKEREESLRDALEAKRTKDLRLVDAIEFALSTGDLEVAEYKPATRWEQNPPTPQQLARLEKDGIDTTAIETIGHAIKIIDALERRRERGLASPRQLKLMKRLKIPSPEKKTKEEARDAINIKTGKTVNPRYENTSPLTALQMVRLRARGIRPADVQSKEAADKILAA